MQLLLLSLPLNCTELMQKAQNRTLWDDYDDDNANRSYFTENKEQTAFQDNQFF